MNTSNQPQCGEVEKMRTLLEIIEAAKSNSPITSAEGRYALCAMDGLATFDRMAIRRLARTNEGAMRVAEGMHARWHNALGLTPRSYLGEAYNPENPEYQERRKMSLKLFDRFLADQPRGGEVENE